MNTAKSDTFETATEPAHAGAGGEVTVFPASFAQRRFWFLDRLMPGACAFNLPSAYRIRGRLDVPALERTFSEIVRRHEILRTTFKEVNGEPSQIIADPQPVRLPVLDLRVLEPAERETRVEACIHDEFAHVFDLARGPLMTVSLLKTGDDEHVLVKNMHHIITDAWSEEVFVREWISLYESFSQNKPAALDPLPIQYADYSEWQKQALQGDAMERQVAYWKTRLDGISPLPLPTDHPRPATASLSGAAVKFTVPRPVADALRALSRQEGVTLFITLLTAFKVLLYRYTGHADIAVGTPITNRNRAELENLIGFFLNTLVLRTNVTGDSGFREILRRVREATLGAFEHQDLPFEVLVEKLQPERYLAMHPLCQVMFVMLPDAEKSRQTGAVTIDSMEVGRNASEQDMILSLFEKGDVIEGLLAYSTALFERETVARMTVHFRTLLESIVADPARPIDELEILSGPERRQILVDWNNTAAPYPVVPLHELVAAQCARTPDAAAVVFEERLLTYSELNGRANKLAEHLQDLGVGPETLVAICAERSIELVVGLLAILKAGGAYVPLDPDYPVERLAFMLSDAKAPVLLTQRRLLARLPPHSAHAICLDEFPGTSANNPAPGVKPENPAYVIYTSGSTGKPKGAINTHRGISNRLLWMQDAYQLTADDRVLQKTPFTFDVSVWEFFWPLMTGARLVVARPGLQGDSGYLIKTIREYKITTLHFVPPMLGAFLTDGNAAGCVSLKRVICSGEALPFETQRQFFSALPDCELHNLYGPTEASVDVTFWKCERDSAGPAVPIGRPVANTQIYILDKAMRPVPAGIAGELHIGGVQLARGYLGRPELTAEKFIPNPFGEGRLYKTGDLARHRADGAIEFLGRLDFQVKVRGFRIELAEIESAIGSHPAVRQCVVLAREDQPGGRRLAAYIVRGGQVEDGDLRAFLKKKLPDYMVPSAFVFLDALPVTPNGKVDRKALPALDRLPAHSREYVAPRTPLEQWLAAIWVRVLGMEQIGVHDNFFELGGHSLMAVTLFTEIEKKLGRNLPLATLFQAPTIEQLAAIIQQESWSPPWSPLVAIQPRGKREPFFCVHGGDGGVMFYSKLAALLGDDQPVYGLQAQGLDGGQIRHASMEAMAALYIKEIRTVQPKGPYFLGGYSFGGVLSLEIARQLRAQGETIALVALFDTNNRMVPPRRYTLRERIALRTRAVAGMSFGRKLAYVFDRGIRKLAVILLMVKHRFHSLAYEIFSKHKEMVAPNYRLLRVQEGHEKALNEYRPSVYPGKLTLIRAENPNDGFEFDSELGWGGLATGGIEIHDVPGEHESIFHEPHVRILAATMKECIEKARNEQGLK